MHGVPSTFISVLQVLSEMPSKHMQVKHVELSPAQSEIYSSLASALSRDDVELGKMSALPDLRFTANHHLLLRRKYTDDKLRRIAADILKVCTKSKFQSLKKCRCFFFQAEDGIRDDLVTGVQTCALPIWFQGFTVMELKVPMINYLEIGGSNGFLFRY